MNAINIGFNSSHWIKLMESSKEYELLTRAFDDGNKSVALYTYATLVAIKKGDIAGATRSANMALKWANMPAGEAHAIDCPFCGGHGYIEIEYTPRHDLENSKVVTASCSACNGVGTMSPMRLFSDYAEDAFPENAVIAILVKDYDTAKEVASAVFNSIEQHRKQVEEDSLDKHLRD